MQNKGKWVKLKKIDKNPAASSNRYFEDPPSNIPAIVMKKKKTTIKVKNLVAYFLAMNSTNMY